MSESELNVDYSVTVRRISTLLARARPIARVDFEERLLFIQSVLTHEEYDRENLQKMAPATYEELLIETLPQVIETDKQYHEIAAQACRSAAYLRPAQPRQ